MADLGTMNVKVGADITGLLSKVDAAKAKLGQLTEENGLLKAELKDLNQSLRKNDSAIAKLNSQISKSTAITKEDRAAVAALRKERDALVGTGVKISAAIKNTSADLSINTTQLKAQTAAVKQAENAGNAFVSGATKVYSGLRKLAYIIPGLGIAGLISLISGPLIDAFQDWINSVDELNAKQKLFKEINEDAAKGASEQVTSLEVLRNKLTDLTKPQSTRIQLAKEYNKIASEGNQINLAEINNLTEINKQIDKQIGLIERQSLAKAAQSKIAGYADKAIDAEFKFQNALRQSGLTEEQVSASIDARMKQTDAVIKKTQQSLDGFNPNKNVIIKPLVPDAKDAISQVQLVDQKLEALLLAKKSAAFQLQDVIKTLLPDISDDSFNTKDHTKGTEKTKKALETISDVIAKMNAQLDVLNKKEILQNISLAPEKVKVVEKAIDELLTKFKLLTDDPHIVELQAKIADINLKEIFKKDAANRKGEKLEVPVDLEFAPVTFDEQILRDQLLEELKKLGIKKTIPIKIGIDVTGEDITGGSEDITNNTSTIKLEETLKDARERIKSFKKDAANIFDDFGTSIASSIGESLGNALDGGTDIFKGLFDSIFNSLGEQLENLGALMIKSGVEIKLAKDAFKKLLADPILAIGIGVGLIALGALIKSSIGRGAPGFATGGYIDGPGTKTSDSILARLSRGEFVIKADTVSKFGVGFFEKLNRGLMPKFDSFGFAKFATGGFVSPNIIRTSQVPSMSGIAIGGGQTIQITGDFQLRNDRLVAAVRRGNAQITRNT